MNDTDDPLAPIRERFVASLENWSDELRALEVSEDHSRIQAECHRVKGTAAMLQLTELGACAKACESIARENVDTDALHTALLELHTTLDQLLADRAAPGDECAD